MAAPEKPDPEPTEQKQDARQRRRAIGAGIGAAVLAGLGTWWGLRDPATVPNPENAPTSDHPAQPEPVVASAPAIVPAAGERMAESRPAESAPAPAAVAKHKSLVRVKIPWQLLPALTLEELPGSHKKCLAIKLDSGVPALKDNLPNVEYFSARGPGEMSRTGIVADDVVLVVTGLPQLDFKREDKTAIDFHQEQLGGLPLWLGKNAAPAGRTTLESVKNIALSLLGGPPLRDAYAVAGLNNNIGKPGSERMAIPDAAKIPFKDFLLAHGLGEDDVAALQKSAEGVNAFEANLWDNYTVVDMRKYSMPKGAGFLSFDSLARLFSKAFFTEELQKHLVNNEYETQGIAAMLGWNGRTGLGKLWEEAAGWYTETLISKFEMGVRDYNPDYIMNGADRASARDALTRFHPLLRSLAGNGELERYRIVPNAALASSILEQDFSRTLPMGTAQPPRALLLLLESVPLVNDPALLDFLAEKKTEPGQSTPVYSRVTVADWTVKPVPNSKEHPTKTIDTNDTIEVSVFDRGIAPETWQKAVASKPAQPASKPRER